MTMHTFTNNLNTSIRLNRDLHMHNKLARYARLATFCHSKYILQKQKAVATIERQQIAVNEPRKSVFISSRQPLAIQTPIFSRPTPSTDVEPSGNHWTFSRLRRHTQPGTFYYQFDSRTPTFGFENTLNRHISSVLNNNMVVCLSKVFPSPYPVSRCFLLPGIPMPLAPNNSRPTSSTVWTQWQSLAFCSQLRRHTQLGISFFKL